MVDGSLFCSMKPGNLHRLVADLGDLLVGDRVAVVALDHQRQWFGAEAGEGLVELFLRHAGRSCRAAGTSR